MKKLNIRIVLIQLIGMIFFVNGIMQLRFYTVADEIFFAKNHFHYQKLEDWIRFFPTKEDSFNFWPNVYIWIFYGLICGILIISYLNWKNKLSALNTIIVAMVMYVLLRLKFFRREVISHFFNPFRTVFSDDFAIQCLIEGTTFTLIGTLILYASINPNLFKSKEATVQD
ncbi:hypothetical protein [Flavobacterium poyangense]|uniref:hypothetical protein n=1 Tax=Flavobacterium poyangense TaxID=2204302 RepID=UPI00141FD38E|nr:hypothetical protein [Flavobacterium sp. JXAS1]